MSIFTTYLESKKEFREKFDSFDRAHIDVKGLESHLTQTVVRVLEVSKENVLKILTDEIATAHTSEAGKTSRLTSAYNRISVLFADTLSLIKEEGDK